MIGLTEKRITVTGGAGFLGSRVVEKLRAAGAKEVFVPRSQDYDLTDMAAVRRMYSDSRPQVVIHLAAWGGGIGANRANPGELFYGNLMLGAQLMEEGRKAGIEKFVAAGNACAYPKFTPVPFKEDDFWNGYPEETCAPYGFAKKMLLVQAQAYRAQYGLNAIYLLPANIYGPGDNFDPASSGVIPALIRKFTEAVKAGHKDVTVWGTGKATRDFLYVDDCAQGVCLAAARYDKPEPVNLGAGYEITIKDLAGVIARLAGFTGRINWDTSKPDGQPRRMLDTGRALEQFAFKAKTHLEEGLRKTIDWYRGGRGQE